MSRARERRAAARRGADTLPSPNIWHWPEIYEVENRAQDVDGEIWRALASVADWAGRDVLDIGCGSGFHLPRFAETARRVIGVEPHEPLVRLARERLARCEDGGLRPPVSILPAGSDNSGGFGSAEPRDWPPDLPDLRAGLPGERGDARGALPETQEVRSGDRGALPDPSAESPGERGGSLGARGGLPEVRGGLPGAPDGLPEECGESLGARDGLPEERGGLPAPSAERGGLSAARGALPGAQARPPEAWVESGERDALPEAPAGSPGVRGTVEVLAGSAQRLPLPDASVDVVHARTAYFFGPGCDPGLAEAERVLRPGGWLVIVDLDVTHSPYGDWMRADLPDYDPAEVDEFFARAGFDCRWVTTRWRFADRESLETVLRIEFSRRVADQAIAEVTGLSMPVGYRVLSRRKPTGLLVP